MINPTDLSGKLAIDVQDMNALRQSAKQNSPDALKAAAKQFEALFMNMVMKSMRDATPQDGPFDTEQSKMYTSMLDQQISQNLAKRGVGLADVLVRQLSANGGVQTPVAPLQNASGALPDPGKINSPQASNVKAFEDRLGAHAEEASLTTGIPAKFMLGQAALESGWGKHEIPAADGSASHNLFGIKATGGWKGRVVEVPTTEYQNGAVQTKLQKFRVYDSYADAFRDYAKLLRSNPRYENVLANAKDAVGFAQGLQRAGYATDPNYAAKLTRIIQQSLSA